jgi:hypothetical protein
VAVLLGLVLWQAAGIAYEVAYSVSQGQSPLSGFALIVLFVVLAPFFVFWLVIKLTVSEAEQTGEEVEEGV